MAAPSHCFGASICLPGCHEITLSTYCHKSYSSSCSFSASTHLYTGQFWRNYYSKVGNHHTETISLQKKKRDVRFRLFIIICFFLRVEKMNLIQG